jgi:RNA polymerase sigma-B factor
LVAVDFEQQSLFRQWDLLQDEVVPRLVDAGKRHGTPAVWALGGIEDAVAVAVAYQHAADKSLWAFASGVGEALRLVGFSLSDIRAVPPERRYSSFHRRQQGWIPDDGIAEHVLLAKPDNEVDLLVLRRGDANRANLQGPAEKLCDGGHVLLTDPPGEDLTSAGFEPQDPGGRLWRKRGVRARGRSQRASTGPSRDMETLARRQYQAELVSSHLRLARSLAHRFTRHGEAKEDLEQVALLALVKAARRYEDDRDTCFSTYATASILGEIKRHFRDRTWMLRVPRSLQELYLAVKECREELTHELSGSPTIDRIAQRLGISEERVLEAMEAGDNYWPESLDAGVYDGEPGREIPVVDSAFETAVERHQLRELIPRLDRREQLILRRLFFDGWTQRQVAEEIGVSQMQVSRLLVATIAKLRAWGGIADT